MTLWTGQDEGRRCHYLFLGLFSGYDCTHLGGGEPHQKKPLVPSHLLALLKICYSQSTTDGATDSLCIGQALPEPEQEQSSKKIQQT